jgi:hypothetical protein
MYFRIRISWLGIPEKFKPYQEHQIFGVDSHHRDRYLNRDRDTLFAILLAIKLQDILIQIFIPGAQCQ